MTILDIISIFVVVANLSLGFFVWWKGKNKKPNVYFFLLMIATSGWILFNWLDGVIKQYSIAAFNLKILFFFPVLIVFFFVNLVINFPNTLKIKKSIKVLIFLVSFFFSIISLTDLVAKDVIIRLGVPINDIVYGSLYKMYGFYLITYFIIGFYLLFKQKSISTGIEKIKTKYLIFSFIIATIFGLFTNLIYPILFTHGIESDKAIISPYGPLVTIVIAILMTYTIIRYRFMDIRVVIKKGFIHFLSLAIILFFYIYLLIISKSYFEKQYSWSEQTTTIVLIVIIAFTVEPLRRLLVKIIDNVFYSKHNNQLEKARQLRTIMSSSLQFDQLLKRITIELINYLNVNTIQFIWQNKKTGQLENYYPDDKKITFTPSSPLFQYLRNYPKILIIEEIPYIIEEEENGETQILKDIYEEMKYLKVGLMLPIGEKGELIGLLLFGNKDNNEAFTSDNIQYLNRLQPQMTGAIANALLYKQAVERIGKIK
ncbi:MAG: histidine kinase N-terminal 7TM domain-containing protein [Patescibacteria group bacterium]|jgi:hypothetical protein